MEKIRIQKYLSECGVMSRRAADSALTDGRIAVNGVTARPGDKIDPSSDTLTIDGRIVTTGTAPPPRTYIMLNKPAGVVTTMHDERGRRSVAELTANVGVRVYPVGRLDMYSDGLLLLTNDGEFAARLMHPRHEIPKIYRVILVGDVPDATLAKLAEPMTIIESDGTPYALAPIGVKLISRGGGETTVELTLKEGRNRQIRRMCSFLGLKIKRLTRTAIGDVRLGSLPPGKWRHLKENEIAYLSGKS